MAVWQLSFNDWFSKTLAELSLGACGTLLCVTPGLKGEGLGAGRLVAVAEIWGPAAPGTPVSPQTFTVSPWCSLAEPPALMDFVCDPAAAAGLMGMELSQPRSLRLCCCPLSPGTRPLVTAFLLLREERADRDVECPLFSFLRMRKPGAGCVCSLLVGGFQNKGHCW